MTTPTTTPELQVVATYAPYDKWRQRLTRGSGHVQLWTCLSWGYGGVYIAGIYLRINPPASASDVNPSHRPIQETWREVMRGAWRGVPCVQPADEYFRDCLELLQALMTATEQHSSLVTISSYWMPLRLARDVTMDEFLHTIKFQGHDDRGGDPAILSAVESFSGDIWDADPRAMPVTTGYEAIELQQTSTI